MKKHVSLLLIAFMGISLVLGGCGKSTSGTPATEARTEAQAGTQTEAHGTCIPDGQGFQGRDLQCL